MEKYHIIKTTHEFDQCFNEIVKTFNSKKLAIDSLKSLESDNIYTSIFYNILEERKKTWKN